MHDQSLFHFLHFLDLIFNFPPDKYYETNEECEGHMFKSVNLFRHVIFSDPLSVSFVVSQLPKTPMLGKEKKRRSTKGKDLHGNGDVDNLAEAEFSPQRKELFNDLHVKS